MADGTNGMQVIDIRDPAKPVGVGGYDASGFASSVAVSGDYAYVANGSAGLAILKVCLPPARPAISANGSQFGFRNGAFGFNVSGLAGQSVVIEASTNLTDWVPVATNAVSSGTSFFSDPSAAGQPRRFYRAVAR